MSEKYVEESVGRTPPQDPRTEQSILGAVLMSKDVTPDVIEMLRGNDFYQPKHENTFESIISLYGHGESADLITVATELDRTGDLQRVDGVIYLHDLFAIVSIATNASYYAEVTREKAILRRLVNASIWIAQFGYQGQGEMDKIAGEAQQTLFEVTGSRASGDYQSLNDLMEPTSDEVEAIANSDNTLSGVLTGFNELDSLTNSSHPDQIIIVAARPGVGKSAFTLDACRAVAVHHDLVTVFFSPEMNCTEIVMKILSAETSVPLQKIRGGRMDENDWQRITDRSATLSGRPPFIDDSPNLTTMEIRAKARRLKQRSDLQLTCIDYIQLMTSGKKVEPRQLEVLEFSRQTELPAKELEVPIIALSQLSRSAERCKDGVPQLANLRESGSLEQDADIVIMLHRPELYTQNPIDKERGQAAFHVLKHRSGQLDRIDALFQGHCSRFMSQPTATFDPT